MMKKAANDTRPSAGLSRSNVILIGMPGSGKSTIGIVLAKALGYDFIDGDLLIQKQTGKKLYELMQERGIDAFLQLEEEINAGIQAQHTVIAPGGSVIYGTKAMEHLCSIGRVIYLQTDLDMLEDRLHDMRRRGVALRSGQTLEDLYQERIPLYEKYADITIHERNHSLGDIVALIIRSLAE